MKVIYKKGRYYIEKKTAYGIKVLPYSFDSRKEANEFINQLN